jgi:hypothetical protein
MSKKHTLLVSERLFMVSAFTVVAISALVILLTSYMAPIDEALSQKMHEILIGLNGILGTCRCFGFLRGSWVISVSDKFFTCFLLVE